MKEYFLLISIISRYFIEAMILQLFFIISFNSNFWNIHKKVIDISIINFAYVFYFSAYIIYKEKSQFQFFEILNM